MMGGPMMMGNGPMMMGGMGMDPSMLSGVAGLAPPKKNKSKKK